MREGTLEIKGESQRERERERERERLKINQDRKPVPSRANMKKVEPGTLITSLLILIPSCIGLSFCKCLEMGGVGGGERERESGREREGERERGRERMGERERENV